MAEMKFYKCLECGKIIAMVKSCGACPTKCCGTAMQEIVPNSTGANEDTHLPVTTINGNVVTVRVGNTAHPMTEEHHISWIAIQTNMGNQRKSLNPGDEPVAKFALLDGEEVIASYAYCTLHSLYKA